ncbi:ABC transporter substrate-binding protein [Klebsiella pneumoniae]|nr:ABC transporter substrate-binding protein [Klebsiella pneumoniae]
MAIFETPLKDVALMAIDDTVAKGGVLGKKLEPVVVDLASNRPRRLPRRRASCCSVIKWRWCFGCWTSVSRKSVLPVFEELNGLLFYPVQYEGEEMSPNVFYTGAAPNQQAIPAVEYLLSEDGGGAKRFFCWGRTTLIRAPPTRSSAPFCMPKGSVTKIRGGLHTPVRLQATVTIVANNRGPAAGGKTAVVSTIMAIPTYRSTKSWLNGGLKATRCTGGGLGGEESCAASIPKPLVGNCGMELLESVDNHQQSLRRRLSRVKRTSCRMPIRW